MKILKPLLIVLCIVTVFSCKKNVTLEEELLPSANSGEGVDIAYLKAISILGFDTAGTRYFNDTLILVENEVIMEKTYLKKVLKDAEASKDSRMAHTNNLVTGNNTNITISLQNNLISDARWMNALKNAVAYYNSVSNCRLNILYAANDVNADIRIFSATGQGFYGLACWPNGNGHPGNSIWVDPLARNTDNSFRTPGQDALMLVHEIGHAIGLRHQDWDNLVWNPTSGTWVTREGVDAIDPAGTYGGATYVPGTVSYDPNSVMNYDIGILGSTWSGFSANDIVALRYLYPLEPATEFESYIFGPTVISPVAQHLHSNGAIGYDCGSYEWRLLNSAQQQIAYFPDAGECGALEWDIPLSPGAYYLQSRLKNVEATGLWTTFPLTVQ